MNTRTRHHVSDEEQEAVLRYAIDVINAVGMGQWLLQIDMEPSPEGTNATVDWLDARYVATIALASDWMVKTDHDRRHTITHEILHLTHSRVSTAIDEGEALLRFHEWQPYRDRIQRELELMVDHFATFMADTHTLTDAWEQAHRPKEDTTDE